MCTIGVGGTVWCWGSGISAQLGDGNTIPVVRDPVQAKGITKATDLALGDRSSCALVEDRVKCWGGNESGQLGDGTTMVRFSPVDVVGLP